MHEHLVEDEDGEVIDSIPFCSDWCNQDYTGSDYSGWSGAHEQEFTTWCANCGVVIPGFMDACSCQTDNVVVARFLSEEGEKCEHGNWIQVPMSYLNREEN